MKIIESFERFIQEKNESDIEVTVYGGKTHLYTKKDIKEMIDDLNLGADDLPKWVRASSAKGMPKNEKEVKALLQKILDHDGSVKINVRSDKPTENEVVFESRIEEGKFNSEVLDLVDEIHKVIGKVKADSSISKEKRDKLFTLAGPLVKALHDLVD
jgi:hypothetical protein